jgi:predicted metal-dependent hydrolase
MTTGTLAYKIKYSRRRSIGIIVTPDDGVIVRAPYRTPVHLIEKFVSSKSVWINKHLENYSGMVRLNNSAPSERKSVLLRGREYKLIVAKAARNSVIVAEEDITVNIKDPDDKTSVSKLIDTWFKRLAARHIASTLDEILLRFNSYRFSPSALSVRTMKRRWGSCSSKGKVTINSELVKLEDRYLEYVILHELCHLHHHNHSQTFYNLLSEVYPNWKETRKELRKYIT